MTKITPTTLSQLTDTLRPSARMPVVFIGHGNPMNAITDNAWSQGWRAAGDGLPRPRAILCISAHWMTRGETLVNVAQNPPTIHDFGGFAQALFDVQYPAPGAPDLARDVARMLADHDGRESMEWGLDHGAWSVLTSLYPGADIPVFQMSIDLGRSFADQMAIGAQLRSLRDQGVLILGSGNLVHNLPAMRFDGQVYDWALEFDEMFSAALSARDFSGLAAMDRASPLYRKAHPTPDHLIPAFYCLGLVDAKDDLTFFNQGIDLGSASMRSFIFSR